MEFLKQRAIRLIKILITAFLISVLFNYLSKITSNSASVDYSVHVVPAITNEQPPSPMKTKKLSIFAAPGEYEPSSFLIKVSGKGLKNVKVSVDILRSKIDTIPKKAIDIRIVKYWYQSGRKIDDVDHKMLTPELLVHDDRLIRVDLERKVNYIPSYIQDSDSLLPFDIPANSFKQLWVNVHVPETVHPGLYSGSIRISPANAQNSELELKLEVIPTKLYDPILDYCVYYRGKLPSGQNPKRENMKNVGSEWKSEKQMELELRDMVEHGISNTVVYQPLILDAGGNYDFSRLKRIVEIRKRLGITNKPLLYNGLPKTGLRDSRKISLLQNRVKQLANFCKENNIPGIYIYGIDEAGGELIRSERTGFKAIHEAGGRVFVACHKNTINLAGDLIDLAIHSGNPSSAEVHKMHKYGHKVYNYANPQCGVEEPLTYRRNYGFLLWQECLDGTCNYAYQHAFNNIWNDFDDHRYRDHVMSYPANKGIIPTIQWEGFREAVDDVRYLSTLLISIKEMGRRDNVEIKRHIFKAKKTIEEIRKMNLMNIGPLDFLAIRRKLATQIINLHKHVNKNNAP